MFLVLMASLLTITSLVHFFHACFNECLIMSAFRANLYLAIGAYFLSIVGWYVPRYLPNYLEMVIY